MRLAVYAPAVAVPRQYARNASGHTQVPLEVAKRLQQAGHDVLVVTSRARPDDVLPAFFGDELDVRWVDDVKDRGVFGRQERHKTRPRGVAAHLWQVRRILSTTDRQLVHGVGHEGTAKLVSAAAASRALSVPAVMTLLAPLVDRRFAPMHRRCRAWLAATEHVAATAEAMGLNAHVARHGVVRRLDQEAGLRGSPPRRRVLFWREATVDDGADLVLGAFDRLAPRYPDLLFTLAVRHHRSEVAGIDELAGRHANVEVHRFPYRAGLGLGDLVASSLVAVLPFRRLTIHPQFAVLETLVAGTPVVTTALGSNAEYVVEGRDGLLVPPGQLEPLVAALESVASGRVVLREGDELRRGVEERWTWDGYAERFGEVLEAAAL